MIYVFRTLVPPKRQLKVGEDFAHLDRLKDHGGNGGHPLNKIPTIRRSLTSQSY